MSKTELVWVTNTEREQCVGLSFKHLKPGQRVKIDKEKITESDMRLINKGLAKISKYVDGEEQAPSPAIVLDPILTPHEDSESAEMITGKVIDGKEPKEADQIITPGDIEAEKLAETSQEDSVTEEETKTEAVDITKHSREELESMSRNELRAIGEPYGITGKAKEKLVEDILAAQDK